MRILKIYVFLFLGVVSLYSQTELKVNFEYDNHSYNYSKITYISEIYKTTDTLLIFNDEMKIQSENNEFIILYNNNKGFFGFIAFLVKTEKETYIVNVQELAYSMIEEINLYDMDDDNTDEVIIFVGDESSTELTIKKFFLNNNNKYELTTLYFNRNFPGLFFNYVEKPYHFSDHKIFVLYEFSDISGYGVETKLGVVKFNLEDKTKELYFEPLGLFSIEEWQKFIKNDLNKK